MKYIRVGAGSCFPNDETAQVVVKAGYFTEAIGLRDGYRYGTEY
jgi:hypothetical protein